MRPPACSSPSFALLFFARLLRPVRAGLRPPSARSPAPAPSGSISGSSRLLPCSSPLVPAVGLLVALRFPFFLASLRFSTSLCSLSSLCCPWVFGVPHSCPPSWPRCLPRRRCVVCRAFAADRGVCAGRSRYYSNRSAAHCSKKAFTEALNDAQKCVQMEPGFARGYGRKGAALYGLGRYADAIVAYKRGLKEDDGNAALKQGLAQAEGAKQRMEAHHASYRPSAPGGYQSQGPNLTEWRPSSSGGATRLAAGVAVLVFSALYIVSAANPMSNDPARYTYHGRAFMAALAGYGFDIQSKWVPCPVSPMEVYQQGVQSGVGQQFAMWAQNLLMGGPAASSFQGLMFCGAFVSNSPVPPALGIIVLVALHDVFVDLNAVVPSVASKMPDLGLLGGLRAHAPMWCAYAEVATVLFLLVNVAVKRDLSVLLQMFLLYQGLSMKFVSAASSAPTKQVWRQVNMLLESSLPGPLKGAYKSVSSMMSKMQQPQ